ncbi:MAG: 2-amino-4-hydroxy-6-hydroxymethyldihydropteridine diphosphokinase [Desulfomonilia bacterium]|nr:2-amino-4-hydroxy-6-hydroxymethyldihydropteridine diphosphokinase [Desulfomonilia bacterium]
MSISYLSLGTNLGERMVNLRVALERLSRSRIMILRLSSVYETEPFEVTYSQARYLNMVIKIDFERDPFALLETCLQVEDSLGRQRPHSHAPRTMDIDVLLIDDRTITHERLTVPHPHMERRPFVIHPLSEIEPFLALPSGRSVAEVKKALGDDEIVGIRKFCHG